MKFSAYLNKKKVLTSTHVSSIIISELRKRQIQKQAANKSHKEEPE